MMVVGLLITSLFTACTEDKGVNSVLQESSATQKESQKANATYMASEGEPFILFNTDFLAALKQDVNQSMRADYPEFDTLSEMKAYIKAGDFTDSEIMTFINSGAIDTAGRLEVFNIEKLYDITAPSDLTKEKIAWEGKYYSISFESDQANAFVCVVNREAYDSIIEEKNQAAFQPDHQILSEEQIEDRDARVVYYQSNTAKLKRYYYTLESNGNELYICEVYRLEMFNRTDIPVSESVPRGIDIVGKNDDGYFHVYLSGFKERPSVEWLSSFGIEDYVEESVEAAVK